MVGGVQHQGCYHHAHHHYHSQSSWEHQQAHQQANSLYAEADALERKGYSQVNSGNRKVRRQGHKNLKKASDLRNKANGILHQTHESQWHHCHDLHHLEGGGYPPYAYPQGW